MNSYLKRNFALGIIAAVLSPQIGVTQAASQFTITISTPGSTISLGSELRVHVTLRNVSSDTLWLPASVSRTQAEMFYSVQVLDKDRKPRPETSYGHSARLHQFRGSVIEVPIAPGETMEEDTILGKQFDLSEPGVYIIQLSRPVSEKPEDGVVKSNELIVTLEHFCFYCRPG